MRENFLLKDQTNFRIGGNARYFAEAHDFAGLQEILREARHLNLPRFILGGGTNILVSDEGFPGVVVKIKNTECEFFSDGTVHVGAGFSFPELVTEAARRGLQGLEWAGGLPGTVGGALRGNAGCFGGEVKDVVSVVESVSEPRGKNETVLTQRSKEQCEFLYRTSVFKKENEIVWAALFKLVPGANQDELLRCVNEKIAYRKERHPMEYPNAGSIFKNCDVLKVPEAMRVVFQSVIKVDPFPVIPTAKIVAETGLKGMRIGGAEISVKHPNFIVNIDRASAEDVKSLIQTVKNRAHEMFAIDLEEEIQYIG